jgi:hypothetical protein
VLGSIALATGGWPIPTAVAKPHPKPVCVHFLSAVRRVGDGDARLDARSRLINSRLAAASEHRIVRRPSTAVLKLWFVMAR